MISHLALICALAAFPQRLAAVQLRGLEIGGVQSDGSSHPKMACPGLVSERNLYPALAILHFAKRFGRTADEPAWLNATHISLLEKQEKQEVDEGDAQATLDDVDAVFTSSGFNLELPELFERRGTIADDTATADLQRHDIGASPDVPDILNQDQYHYAQSLQEPVWVFSAYHKTGTVLSWKIINAFNSNRTSEPFQMLNKVHDSICEGDTEIFSKEVWSNAYGWPAVDVVRVLPNYRLVHFIRDPVNLIISAFRYHQLGPEKWLFSKNMVKRADKKYASDTLGLMRDLSKKFGFTEDEKQALTHFRQAAQRGMNLVDFYRAAPEEEAIMVEAYRSWPEIVLVMHNYELTKKDRWALQMRMESQQEDFHGSMRCMFKFLSGSRPLNVAEALRVVEPLDVSKHPKLAHKHSTSGKYDNDRITAVLESMAPITEARRVLSDPAVYEC